MFCKKCGKELNDEWVRCPYCGAERGIDNIEEYTAKENDTNEKSNGHENNTYSSDKIGQINFWKFLLLSVITFGIYGIYILCGYVKNLNKVCEGDGRESKSYIIVFLLSIVTCGIYGLYWWYIQAERLYNAASGYGVKVKEKGSHVLIWMILGCTVMPWIGMLAAIYIMFDNMNRIALVYNNEISVEELAAMENPHPHLIRNVLIIYGMILLLEVVGLMSEAPEENGSDRQESVEEPVADLSDIDLEKLIGQPESVLEQTGIDLNEDESGYEMFDGNVRVSCADEKICTVLIKGDGENLPGYHGIRTGMNIDEAEMLLKNIYARHDKIENKIGYVDLNTGIYLILTAEDENITEISARLLKEEELKEYNKEKEEAAKKEKEKKKRAKEKSEKAARKEYIFPDSDKKYLTEDEVLRVDADKLKIGRNEIFARHGYIFKSEDLKKHFSNTSWYKGTVKADKFNADKEFNDFEKKNVELIKRIEDEINGVAAAKNFIGIRGEYQCGSDTEAGIVNVRDIRNGVVYMDIGTHEYPYLMENVEGEIIDDHTVTYRGMKFIWTDVASLYILDVPDGFSDTIWEGIDYLIADYYHVS